MAHPDEGAIVIGGEQNDFSDESRFAALYFDKAIICRPNQIGIDLSPLEMKLLECKFAQVKKAHYSGFSGSRLFDGRRILDDICDDILADIPASQNGRWSVMLKQDPDTHLKGQSAFATAFLELHSHFPVPRKDTSIEQILKFNRDNGKKLRALRSGLGKIAADLVNADSKSGVLTSIEDRISDSLEHLKIELEKRDFNCSVLGVKIGLQVPANILESLLQLVGTPLGVASVLSNSVSISFGAQQPYNEKCAVDWCYILDAKKQEIL